MQSYTAKTKLFPQFERSPEAFPKLTIFPEAWDLVQILNSIPEEKLADPEVTVTNQPKIYAKPTYPV